MELFKNKRCPRCSFKMPKESAVCPGCRLNFEKYNSATNKVAKEKLSQGEKESVIMRSGVPVDVSRIKLLLITLFIGFTGAHYFYVGRKKMGWFCLAFFVVGLINASFSFFTLPQNDLFEIVKFLSLIWGIVLIIWLIDIFKVSFNKFKIPVSR